ncbi:MAG: methionyl-tRNA formyltransferase [Clostridiales bacterium]|jgi:methionyl-tRNA formyltransferase|nr:methionyl-tRNA formyltransferase [Clostridiales bacterium]
MKDTRIVFMGTPDFAVDALHAVAAAFTVVAVVTQPDRPSGRGKKTTQPAVKNAALELGIHVVQPVKMKDDSFLAWLKELAPDFIVTAAYGRILPPSVLAAPKVAALNIHASLLPRYRGAAPIHRAVINGDTESGITIMHMDAGMDTGDIIFREAVSIGFFDTTGNLHDELASLGAEMIVKAVPAVLSGTAPRLQQDESLATLAPPLRREEELINWNVSANIVHNQVRGMNPWPGAYTFFNGDRLKIWAGVPEDGGSGRSGMVQTADEDIVVSTGEGSYRITSVQPPGKKAMSAGEFLRGNNVPAGTILGG